MEMKDLELPSLNRFASDYLQGHLEVEDYFHYDLSSKDMYHNRYKELMNRTFLRQEVADYIENYMARLPKSDAVMKSISDLRKEGSVVVIGGQQAGLLTGPLYTIHKVISIIKLAKEQEEVLKKRVIPVFWIAGEDHDVAEVNHVYVMKEGKPTKKTYPSYQLFKTMVSDIELDAQVMQQWFEEIIETYGETNYTSALLANMKTILCRSKTFVDFFSALIHEWFHEYGLLLIDAADPQLRQLEAQFFTQMVERHEDITAAVCAQQAFIQEQGYRRMIEMDANAVNLFYYNPEKKDRCLLERNNGQIIGKNGELRFTKQELLQTAKDSPERLSNNVVTRPLMQEMLFPVLAFISGPGEIAYWAELKRVFDLFEMKMPPIVPRLNITLVERGIETDLQEVGLELETVLIEGTEKAKESYLESVKDPLLEQLYDKMKRDLQVNHQQLSEHAVELDKGLQSLLHKNRFFIEQQLDFIYGKMEASTKEKNAVVVRKYDRIAQSLYPLHSPQERIWNIFYYVNKYGPDFVQDLMDLSYSFNNQHKLIYV
ncbi:bacillithiol biosynthesis cysteine-adding enzyme BshC [Peribacillus asahii]|uniref:bacillithiol biosynthesis cysteine-adding enzyme BshC n=1 Tax=Peribacillus asahii TaxID=228899 RepID=UPI00207A307A|nr:bacillithiol biosynthesis cysteine-adding enzyme BshC [Peribacillus asahii]USK61115.1 bacillithiol biosynthesis cysteine-adding enzyme BshC [Peribacillus asahii]